MKTPINTYEILIELAENEGFKLDVSGMDVLYRRYIDKIQTELYAPTQQLMLDTIKEAMDMLAKDK